MKATFDRYGQSKNSAAYGTPRRPYEIDASDTVSYIRYDSGTASMPVFRITVEGTVTRQEISFGAWADRATLIYVPVNDEVTV